MGRRATDKINAGDKWLNVEVVADQEIATRRNLGDLKTVAKKITEGIAQGRHERRRLVEHPRFGDGRWRASGSPEKWRCPTSAQTGTPAGILGRRCHGEPVSRGIDAS